MRMQGYTSVLDIEAVPGLQGIRVGDPLRKLFEGAEVDHNEIHVFGNPSEEEDMVSKGLPQSLTRVAKWSESMKCYEVAWLRTE